MLLQKTGHLVGGLGIIAFNLLWVWFWVDMYHHYQNAYLLFIYMVPDWIIFMNIGLGFVGILIGFLVISKSIGVKIGVMIDATLLLLGFGTDLITTIF